MEEEKKGNVPPLPVNASGQRDVSPLHLDRSAPPDRPGREAARALFARMLRARRRAGASYLAAGIVAVCVLAVADAVGESRPFTLMEGVGLFLNHLGAPLLTVAALAVPSFRARSTGLLLAYIGLTFLTQFLNGVELSFAKYAVAPTLFFLLAGNRWVKTIALVIVLMAMIPLVAFFLAALVMGDEHPFLFLPSLFLFVALGVLGLFLLAHAYDRKFFSDVSIELTFLWIVFLVTWIAVRKGDRVTWAAALAFVLYEAVVYAGLLTVRHEARGHPPVSLLVLRVFRTPERSHSLFERVGTRWRYAGPIHLIAGTDSAIPNLDPSEAVRCLTFRTPTLFVSGDADLRRRVQELDCAPDPDGRYRVNDFFCFDHTWRDTFEMLLRRSDVVLVDLAGYSPDNAGVTYELAQLLAQQPLHSFVLLTDRTTNVEHLEGTLQRLWRELDPAAPNAQLPDPAVRVLHEPKAHQLVAALCDAVRRG